MTESARAPAAAVAEWPEGKELEDGVFISGATPVSHIKGRARSKRYLVPSANVQEPATAAQGTMRAAGSKPVKRRSTEVKGAHLRPKTARKVARSRSLTLRAKPFKILRPSSLASGGHCRRRRGPLLPGRVSKVE